MPYFYYVARDENQNLLSDQMHADDAQAARRRLEELDLQVVELHSLVDAEVVEASHFTDDPPPDLDQTTSKQLLRQILELQQAGCPLDSGLLAAAASAPTRRLAQALRHLATRLQQGTTPEEVLYSWSAHIPPHVLGLIAAVRRAGHGDDALLELMEHEQSQGDLRTRVWGALAYPLTMLALALLLFIMALLLINRPMRGLLEDMNFSIPGGLELMLWWGDFGVWLILGGLLVLGVLLLVCRAILLPEYWHVVLASAPLIGVVHWWSGIASFLRLLGLLLRRDIPLPEALNLVEAAMSDASIKRVCRTARQQVLAGRSLWQALLDSPRIPNLAIAYLHHGEQRKELGKACDAAADLFEARIAIRLDVLHQVVPALVFLLILALVVLTVTLVVTPILSLIQAFS